MDYVKILIAAVVLGIGLGWTARLMINNSAMLETPRKEAPYEPCRIVIKFDMECVQCGTHKTALTCDWANRHD